MAGAGSWQNNCFIPTIPYAIQRQTFSEDFLLDWIFFLFPSGKISSLSMDFDCYINLI